MHDWNPALPVPWQAWKFLRKGSFWQNLPNPRKQFYIESHPVFTSGSVHSSNDQKNNLKKSKTVGSE
jgi:hypothetical protein